MLYSFVLQIISVALGNALGIGTADGIVLVQLVLPLAMVINVVGEVRDMLHKEIEHAHQQLILVRRSTRKSKKGDRGSIAGRRKSLFGEARLSVAIPSPAAGDIKKVSEKRTAVLPSPVKATIDDDDDEKEDIDDLSIDEDEEPKINVDDLLQQDVHELTSRGKCCIISIIISAVVLTTFVWYRTLSSIDICVEQLKTDSGSDAPEQQLNPWCANMVVFGNGAFSSPTCYCTVLLSPNNYEIYTQVEDEYQNMKVAVVPDHINKVEGARVFLMSHTTVRSVPDSLWNLENVELFMLVNNPQLSGPLPENVDFPRLDKVFFSRNNFTGPLPATWGESLSGVKMLSVSKNKLNGTLPSEWSRLTDLFELSLFTNLNITGTIPQEWSAMESLKLFYMEGTNITLSDADSTAPFPNPDMAIITD